ALPLAGLWQAGGAHHSALHHLVALLHHLHHALHVRALHRTVWALRLLRIESGRGGGAGDEDASEGEGYHEVTHGRISFRRGVQAASGRLARSRIELRSEPGSQLTLQSPRSICLQSYVERFLEQDTVAGTFAHTCSLKAGTRPIEGLTSETQLARGVLTPAP